MGGVDGGGGGGESFEIEGQREILALRGLAPPLAVVASAEGGEGDTLLLPGPSAIPWNPQ